MKGPRTGLLKEIFSGSQNLEKKKGKKKNNNKEENKESWAQFGAVSV